ncbi:hypothetical protein [Vibrio furnissii]|uniref:hypothetical protein n=1 Tax=Vibrio furnissii TaxID=29494 RepID=UPI002572F048|nr:hypothetical protein [Vibrio furnissii]WJG21755.1 hypothetical protein QSU95_00715 [Vibrio furnissii]
MNHGWGDIYTYNGILYKVQVVGNALIPFGFFVNFYLYKIGKVGLWILFVYGLAIVFCGNLAFYLFTVFFIIAYHGLEAKGKIKLSLKNIFYLLGALSLTLLFSVYVIESIIMKSSGDVSSIGTRFDQARVLISDMSGSYRELLFGKGLGNTLTIKTQSRDYTGEIYFEIQSLYIVNQIGFIGIITFVCFHLKLISYFLKNNKIILIYICYIGYAMTNPYMFDSNHGIALIILMSLSNLSLKGYRKE